MTGHDHDEQRLREVLQSAPTIPTTPGGGAELARQGAQRRRKRRLGAGAGAVAVAVALAVTLAGVTLRDAPDGSPVADPSTPPTATDLASAPDALTCARPPVTPVQGAPVVPDGAVAARLCGGMIDNGGFDMVWPADTLQGAFVDRLVDRINDLSPYVQPEACSLPYSPPFDLLLEYSDGSQVWAHGDTAGSCENLSVDGGAAWRGAPQVLAAARRLIDDQRAGGGTAPSSAAAARCPQSWQDVTYTDGAAALRPGAEVAVTACRYRLENGDPTTITQSWAGALVREVLVDDPRRVLRLVAAGSRTDPCSGVAYDLERTQDVLLVRDRYGDVQLVSTTPCWPSTLTGPRLYPSSDLADLVAGLVAGQPDR